MKKEEWGNYKRMDLREIVGAKRVSYYFNVKLGIIFFK